MDLRDQLEDILREEHLPALMKMARPILEFAELTKDVKFPPGRPTPAVKAAVAFLKDRVAARDPVGIGEALIDYEDATSAALRESLDAYNKSRARRVKRATPKRPSG